jgi:excisionase family DNA binding protein
MRRLAEKLGITVANLFSTSQAAKKLGVTLVTLQRHVSSGRVKAPKLGRVGGIKVRLWTDRDIDKARKILATIKPGRKPRKK